jgi:hypothetical protein
MKINRALWAFIFMIDILLITLTCVHGNHGIQEAAVPKNKDPASI